MKTPVLTKALIRFFLSIPLLVLLFGSAALPGLLSWSRLPSFTVKEQNLQIR